MRSFFWTNVKAASAFYPARSPVLGCPRSRVSHLGGTSNASSFSRRSTYAGCSRTPVNLALSRFWRCRSFIETPPRWYFFRGAVELRGGVKSTAALQRHCVPVLWDATLINTWTEESLMFQRLCGRLNIKHPYSPTRNAGRLHETNTPRVQSPNPRCQTTCFPT